MDTCILFETREAVAHITLNRPAKLNALNMQMLRELDVALDAIEAASDVRVILLKGSGEKAFAAGADINEMAAFTPEEARAFSAFGNGVFRRLSGLPQPSIALIHGYALGGGCELAQACDIRLADEKACFSQPEVSLGIIPGFGGTQRLLQLVGPGRAKMMLFSGSRIDAATALNWGLVDKVLPADRLENEGLVLAHSIAANAPYAVSQCKRSLTSGQEYGLDTRLSHEAMAFALCFGHPEQKQRMRMDKK